MINFLKKMTDKGTTNKQIYSWIYGASATITIFLLELFTQFDLSISGFLKIFGIYVNNNVKTLLDFIFEWVAFSFLFVFFKWLIIKGYKFLWIKSHLDIYVDGQWIVVHEKSTVRIGIADIEQDFFDVQANAFNINTNKTDNTKKTQWHYIGTAFKPDINSDIRFIGSYLACRKDEPSKQGIQMYNEFEFDDKCLVRMKGEFGDVLRAKNGMSSQDANDKTGKIHMYKLTKKLREYIDFESIDKFDEKKLVMILQENDQNIQQERFVRDLREMFYRCEIQKIWKELSDTHFNNDKIQNRASEVEADQAMTNVIIYMVFADGEIQDNELENLNNITGRNWTLQNILFHRMNDKASVINAIESIMEKFNNDPYAKSKYKEIIKMAIHLIAFSNYKIDIAELSFINEVEEALNKKNNCTQSHTLQ